MLNSQAGWENKARLAHERSRVLFEIAPRVVDMPALIQKYDDPFLPYCRAVFAATGDFAAGYVLDLAAFLALGAAGAVALERAAAILAVTPPTLSILHGPFARAEYAAFCGPTALRVDAATVTDREVASAFDAQAVTGLLDATNSTGDWLDRDEGTAMLAGWPFQLIRQPWLDQFKREDFVERLRAAAATVWGHS